MTSSQQGPLAPTVRRFRLGAFWITSILDGADLNRETLLRLGYVTQLVDRSAQSPP